MKLNKGTRHWLTPEQTRILETSPDAVQVLRLILEKRLSDLRDTGESEALLDEPNYQERKTFLLGRVNELKKIQDLLPTYED